MATSQNFGGKILFSNKTLMEDLKSNYKIPENYFCSHPQLGLLIHVLILVRPAGKKVTYVCLHVLLHALARFIR